MITCETCGGAINPGQTIYTIDVGESGIHYHTRLEDCLAATRTRVAELEAAQGWRHSSDEKPLPDGREVEIRATALYDESGWDIYIMGDIVESFPAHCPSIEWRPAPPTEATP